MEKAKRKRDLLTDEQRAVCVKKIIGYFDEERGEKIGVVAAGKLLDLFLSLAAEQIYARAIEDAKVLAKKRDEDLEVDLSLLANK